MDGYGVDQAVDGFAQSWHIIRRYMNYKKSAVLIFTCLFLANATSRAAKEDTANAEALISRARLQEEIWTAGTPPMLMRAEVQVSDAKGALVHGDYTFNWVSPSQWREEIRFGSYERLRVRDAKGYWQKSRLNYQPETIFHLDTMLHLKDAVKVGSKQSLGKVKNRGKSGIRQQCTEVKGATGTERIMCFDEADGALVSVEYPRGENQNSPEISRIEYGAFNSVGGKLVPYEIRALNDGRIIAAVRVLEITKITEENPTLFNVPVNSEFWAQCDDMQEAELVGRVQPSYPSGARTNHEQGRVILYVVIEANGSLSHMTIIHRATPALEAAAVEAMRQWRYKPAVCGQTPIRVETSIHADFWLRY
jgi:TonB family protein